MGHGVWSTGEAFVFNSYFQQMVSLCSSLKTGLGVSVGSLMGFGAQKRDLVQH